MKPLFTKRIILIGGLLPVFISGCTGLSGTQRPAPVYTSNHPYNLPQSRPQLPVVTPKNNEVVQVQPLQDFTPIVEPIDIKTEPLATPEPISVLTPAKEPSVPSIHNEEASGIPKIIEVPAPTRPLLMPTPPANTGVPKFEPVAPAEFKPSESSSSLSPAVTALVSAASQSSKTGDLESAAAAIERAIRIEPRNGELLYKLAVLRLKQSKPVLAEDLAKKSALLAGKDNALKKSCWLLIAHAKEMQGDGNAAALARGKAAEF